MTLSELIAALEAADGPSRGLDAEIFCELTGRIVHAALPVGYTMVDYGDVRRNELAAKAPYISNKRGPAPRYTSSIDAAVTLVPEGEEWAVICSRHKVGREGFLTNVAWVGLEQIDTAEPQGATPALALCIAALKAREAEE